MFKKLKERIKFRRRRKVEKKLRKYFDKYVHMVESNDVKSMTEGELHHIEDVAHYCLIDAKRIMVCTDLQERRRFGSKCCYLDDLIKEKNNGRK